jgi:SAM-dependent methyltransferase
MAHDSQHDPYYETNRNWWDGVVPIHEVSRGYNRDGFLRGEQPLCPVELAELGPLVPGKTLLHLQCHFGMDTLNWARLGAVVTGLDFSLPALEAARRLSADSGIPGRFVHANVYEAREVLGETFDIVYTGIGALNWLPDIAAWARVAAGCVKPGGALYVYEGHPVLWMLDTERADQRLVVKESYFELAAPVAGESETTYVDGPALTCRKVYEWNHGKAIVARRRSRYTSGPLGASRRRTTVASSRGSTTSVSPRRYCSTSCRRSGGIPVMLAPPAGDGAVHRTRAVPSGEGVVWSPLRSTVDRGPQPDGRSMRCSTNQSRAAPEETSNPAPV